MKRIFIRIFWLIVWFVVVLNSLEAQLISVQPQNDSICKGDDASFQVVVVDNLSDTTFSWQIGDTTNNIWTTLINNSFYHGVHTPLFEIDNPWSNIGNAGNVFFRCIVESSGEDNDTSQPRKIVFYEALETNPSADQQICSGDTPDPLSSNPTGGTNGNYLFQWQNSLTGNTWNNISGATSETFQPGALSETTYFRVILNNELGCNEHISNPIEVTVYDALSTNPSDDQQICAGDIPGQLSSNPNGGPNSNYFFQWQDSIANGSWSDISGATLENYQPGSLSESTWYRVKLDNDIGCSEHISAAIVVMVYDALSTEPSGDQQICNGDMPMEINSNPGGGPNTNYTFQWQDSIVNGAWTNITGATAENYQPGLLSETTWFRVMLDNDIGCAGHISGPVEIAVYPVLATSPTGNQEICSGSIPAELMANASGGPNSNYTYQWQDSIQGGSWTDIPGAGSGTYQPEALTQTTYFRVILNNNTGCTENISDPLQVTVFDQLSIGISEDQSICTGNAPDALTSEVSGGSEDYSFSWESSSDGNNWTAITGANEDIYQPPELTSTTYFHLIVNDGDICGPVTSNSIEITILDQLPVSIQILTDTTSICQGENVVVTAMAQNQGDNPVFTWKLNGSITGTTNTGNFTFQNLADGDEITCMLESDITCAINNPATSNSIVMNVMPFVDATISILASKNPACGNDTITFSIDNYENGGDNPQFEWFLNGNSKGIGTEWSAMVNLDDQIVAQLTSNAYCVTTNPVNSDPVVMTVNPSPDLSVLIPKPLKSPVVLICQDSAAGYTYSWFENGDSIKGAHGQYYYPLDYGKQFNSQSSYFVRVTNEYSCSSQTNSYKYIFDKSALFGNSDAFIIYPNPGNGEFTLMLNDDVVPEGTRTLRISIYDLEGKIVYRADLSVEQLEFRMRNPGKGIYLLYLDIPGLKREVKKLIIK